MQRNKNVPIETRTKILQEYRSGLYPVEELCEKYGISSRHIIQMWDWRYGNQKINVSLPLNPKKVIMAKKKTTDPVSELELLRQKVKELESDLHTVQLQNLGLNTMIDIAEEQGIEIRKKSGAKQ